MLKILEKWLYKPKYVVVFLQKYNERYVKDHSIVFKSIDKLKKANNEMFIIDVEHPAYSYNNAHIFFVEKGNNTSISFYEKAQPLNIEEIDLIVANRLLYEITRGLMNDTKQLMIYLIIGVVVGALIGGFICYLIMSNKIANLYQDWIDSKPDIIGMIKIMKVGLFG